MRAFRGHFTPEHHHGVELPGIYWHFVDVMWIVVYATIYLLLSALMARVPFRSEAEAYRFLLLTVGYFALIVAAAAIATWLGVVVFVVLTAAAVWLWLRSRSDEPVQRTEVRGRGGENERRILVIANETVGGEELLRFSGVRSEGVPARACSSSVPALNSQVRTWASDEDGARAAAQARLDAQPRPARA